MEHPPAPTAVETLRHQLEALARSESVRMLGLDPTMIALRDAIAEQARHQSQLANAICVLELEVCRLMRVLEFELTADRKLVQRPFSAETLHRLRVIFEAGQR